MSEKKFIEELKKENEKGLRGRELMEEFRKENEKYTEYVDNVRIYSEEESKKFLEEVKKNPMSVFGPHCDYNGDVPFDEFYKRLMAGEFDET